MSETAHHSTNEKFESCRQYLMGLGADKLLHSGRHFLAHMEGTYLAAVSMHMEFAKTGEIA